MLSTLLYFFKTNLIDIVQNSHTFSSRGFFSPNSCKLTRERWAYSLNWIVVIRPWLRSHAQNLAQGAWEVFSQSLQQEAKWSVFRFEWTRNCDSDWLLDFFIIVFSVENRSKKSTHGQRKAKLLSTKCPCIFSINLMRFWIHVCEIYQITSSCSNLGNLRYYFELNLSYMLFALCFPNVFANKYISI